MISSRLSLFVVLTGCTVSAFATEEPATAPRPKDILKARLAAEAKSDPAKQTPAAPPTTPTAQAVANGTASDATGDKSPLLANPAPNPPPSAPDSTKSKPAEPPAVLPTVEVKKGRITKLDQALAKQDQDIAREQKNTKISDVDKALNDSKIARPLSIFGGESSQFRQRVASERVSLMEDEKDLIEAIAHAKTKEDKAALQKQLDTLRTQRRELEKALR